jgi:hypothetical protein
MSDRELRSTLEEGAQRRLDALDLPRAGDHFADLVSALV